MRGFRVVLLFVCLGFGAGRTASADEVTRWNQVLFRAAATPPATSPLVISRTTAIVQAAVFDALNGIERRFTPVHVEPSAAPGASRRAAVVQAAYATLVALYPAQKVMLDIELEDSLRDIASGAAAENSVAIERGVSWGQYVADQILQWRSTDGFNTSPAVFTGAPIAVGRWRPTPPSFALGAGYPQFSGMTPWVMDSPAAFRPGPPPVLSSVQYVSDFNEVKTRTTLAVQNPTSDAAVLSVFWNAGTASAYWNRVAVAFAEDRHLTISENARLMAAVNLAMADAAIGCWEAKYTYVFWRPITAIAGANDGNPATAEDPTWTTLLPAPAHPEYPSGHSCQSGAAGRVLIAYFGDETPFTLESNSVAGQYREYANFTDALDEVKDARVFSGIHFRTATEVGQALGAAVADHVLTNALLPVRGRREGQLR